ncbi:hypothetical protein FRC14_000403 [Serendipita sp. 396]|nr:hypothetical protein FRC14_000403 [Serendipita sp. 396]KAG8775623.1 hypothetical protein FRC15_000429 [Serendipita sp. 397]KAG8817455.1 hypothetical protein FRC18_000500 [Serendipita sp. 400]KAG8846742.1 hypothetical protein FRB91_000503 [Serendipita sp. 411]KAG8856715.1 hypothetical protein FRC20_000413 [Serendipita sp. 405]
MKDKATIPSLPIEIWQTILRYSIAVPVFFDPDFVGSFVLGTSFVDLSSTWNSEEVYWETERKRNKISRVCKRWKNYLTQFQHRFVRMEDIRRGTLQPEVLKHAIRISLNSRTDGGIFDQTWQCPMDYHDLSVEIITFAVVNRVLEEMILHVGALKHLVTVHSETGSESGTIPIMAISGPLRHLHPVQVPDSSSQNLFTSESLVSLTIDLPACFFANVEISPCRFPNLQTLRVLGTKGRGGTSIAASFVVPFLCQQAPGIKRLYIYEKQKEELLPYEIWDLCPHLEIIGISIMPGPPPPTSHPVSEFVFSYPLPRYQGQLETSFFPFWPHLKTITTDASWNPIVLICPVPWILRSQQLGIRFQDAHRVSWEEYSTKRDLSLDGESEWIIGP